MRSHLCQPFLRVKLQKLSLHAKGIRQSSWSPTRCTSFPSTLIRYNSRQRSSLYDRNKRDERPDDPAWDGIEISRDGLIHPGASTIPSVYKGAMLMPNTFTMQELIRNEIDYYYDNEEQGKVVEVPHVHSIRKGTVLPKHLVLFREGLSRFSLQPATSISIADFNDSLDKFYDLFADKYTAEEWLENNDFQSAVGDDAESTWMAR